MPRKHLKPTWHAMCYHADKYLQKKSPQNSIIIHLMSSPLLPLSTMLLPELPKGNGDAAAPRPPLALVRLRASKPCAQADQGSGRRRATTMMDRVKKGGEARSGSS